MTDQVEFEQIGLWLENLLQTKNLPPLDREKIVQEALKAFIRNDIEILQELEKEFETKRKLYDDL